MSKSRGSKARARETPEERQERLARRRLRRLLKAQEETPEEAKARKGLKRALDIARRARETPLEREERLSKSREEWEARRSRETPEQRKKRLAKRAEARRLRAESETPEQKKRRLARLRAYWKEKSRTDPSHRIARALRVRIRKTLLFHQVLKVGSAVRDLGCTPEELRKHLEYLMKEGMTWDNYGPWHETEMRWHIDHVKPLASFDLTDREQFLEACHYTNLQPLWARENLSKGART